MKLKNSSVSIEDALRKIDVLTSLRFFAALAVFVYHAKLLDSLLSGYRLGDVGVAFFFLLSGFIMTYVYHKKLSKLTRRGALKFYASRFAKIYPLHIVTFLLAAPPMLKSFGVVIGGPFNELVAQGALANLTLTQGYSNNPAILYSFNNVSWTLSLEVLFYILFPVAMFIMGKRIRNTSARRIAAIGFALWTIMIFFNFALPQNLMVLPLIRLPEFFLGVMIGVLFLNRPNWSILRNKSKATALELTALALAFGNLALYPLMPEKTSIAVCLAPSLVLLIGVFAYQRGYISQFLSRRAFVFLGEISFSFYMIHMMVLGRLNAIGDLGLTLFALVVSLALSVVAYLFIEEPARKKIKTILDRQIEKRHQQKATPETAPENIPA